MPDSRTRLPRNSGRRLLQRPPARQAPQHRHAGRPARGAGAAACRSQTSTGPAAGSPRSPRRASGHPWKSPSSSDGRVERRRDPSPSEAAQTATAVASSISRSPPSTPAGPAADQRRRIARLRTASSVASGAARCAPDAKTTARSARRAAEPGRRLLPRGDPGPTARRQSVDRPQPIRMPMLAHDTGAHGAPASRDLRTDRRRQDRRRDRATPPACALAGERPVAVSADALQVYRGPRNPDRRRPPRPSRRALEHRLISCVAARDHVQRRPVRGARPRRDRRTPRRRAGARSCSAGPASTSAPP